MSQHHCHSTEQDNASSITQHHVTQPSCHQTDKKRIDYFLWGSVTGVAFFYIQFAWFPDSMINTEWYGILASSVYELMNTMWWGITLGILMVALLSRIPREFVMSVLGTNAGARGIVRSTLAGVLLDLCSHGILMVGAKLYERGASIGQVMAFLIASPWNSFSLTLILIALIGFGWTLAFIGLSMLIAILAGLIFDYLVGRGTLPSNPNKMDLPEGFKFWPEAKSRLENVNFTAGFFQGMLVDGVKGSTMVIRWIMFGILLAGLVRAFVSPEAFGTYFGPTLAGLGLTIIVATILEVCSEGSTPIAADLLTRANAPGNSFAFLMTGVSTDYTEIMVLKQTTKSWKIALFLPLLTVPQVIFIAWLMNGVAI